jgi:hypothetical protein
VIGKPSINEHSKLSDAKIYNKKLTFKNGSLELGQEVIK